jgi:TPR repeat protein
MDQNDAVPETTNQLGGYSLLRVLGEGGMGLVYEAADVKLGRRVALKVMRAEAAGSAANRERFVREARTAASIESDHVCPIYQVGVDDGIPFIVMPLLRGETLADRLRREKALPVAEVARLGREIALGLAAAHAAGLVHRDIKPANVWLEESSGPSRVRLLDFGLARGESDGRLTRLGEVLGTPAYLSLEQARGQPVDARSDLFSLGVILYEMTTGKRPFRGNDLLGALSSLAMDTPRPPNSLRPEAPSALSGLVMHLLEKEPAKRPADAAEVAQRLAVLQDSTPLPVVSGNYVLLMNSGGGPPARGAWGRLAWAAMLGLVLALGGGLAAFALAHRGGDEGPPVEGEKAAEKGEKAPPDGEEQRRAAREAGYQAAMRDGRAAAADGKWAEAAGRYAEALTLKEGDPEAVAGRKAAQEQLDRAERLAAQARRRETAYQDAMRQARAALDAGRWADAAAAFDAALARKANDEEALRGRKAAQAELARTEEAKKKEVARLEQARKKEAAYRDAMKRGDTAMKSKKYEEARHAYAEALRHRPGDPAAQGGDEDAARLLARQEAAAKREAAYRAAMVRAAAAMKAKKYDEAREAYAEALQHRPRDPEAGKGDGEAVRLLAEQRREARGREEAEKMFRDGLDFHRGLTKEIDDERAAKLFRQAADKGHPLGGAWVGWVTYHGRGVEKDEAKGLRLLAAALPTVRKQAEGGDADAQALLGALLATGLGVRKDEKQAVELYRKAADKGHVAATFRLAGTYSHGLGVDKDEKKAVELYKKAADKGHAAAMANLAMMYANGRGVEKDEKKAVELYKKAADKGHAAAMARLGFAYEKGQGVEKDEKKAFELYKKAADRGDAVGTNNLGATYANGKGVDRDDKKAFELFQKAADKNLPHAIRNLGSMYAHGRGVDKDEKKAIELYKKAADKGDASAMLDLGWAYAAGRGVTQDWKEANRWYRMAADKGNAIAMYNLAFNHERGRGVDKDEKEALKWYRKAAEGGHVGAKKKLEQLESKQ